MKPDPETLARAEEQARTVERGPTRPYGEWRREMAEPRKSKSMVSCEHCADMVIAARRIALEEAIVLVEIAEKYGRGALTKVLDELRSKRAALLPP